MRQFNDWILVLTIFSTWESLFQMIPDTGFQYTLCWHPTWTCMHIAMALDAWLKQCFQQGETTRLDINCLNQNHPCMDLPTKRNNNCKYFVLYNICQEVTMVQTTTFKYLSSQHNTGQIDSIIITQILDILPFQKITLICPVLDIIKTFGTLWGFFCWWSLTYMVTYLCPLHAG